MWQNSFKQHSAKFKFNPYVVLSRRRGGDLAQYRRGDRCTIHSFAMGKKNKTTNVAFQSQEDANFSHVDTDAKVLAGGDMQIDATASQSQSQSHWGSRDGSWRHQQQQGQSNGQFTQSTSQISNANSQPRRKSRQSQWQQQEMDDWSRSQNVAFNPNNTSAAAPSFDNNSMNTMNTWPSPYMPDSGFMPIQNTNNNNNNMMNFGWGPSYTMPTSFNQAPALPVSQPQWLQMQFAQQMMMTQHMFNSTGLHQQQQTQQLQQTRPMSTAVPPSDQETKPFESIPPSETPAVFVSNDNNTVNIVKQPQNMVKSPKTPVPLPAYLAQAKKEPKDLHFHQPLLIILDLNGTLLYRKRKKFPPQFVRRPALNYFLERLTARHTVMVWSSSQPETVNAICDTIFSEVQKQKLVAKWGRDKLGLSPQQYLSKVQVYKQLEKVWADKKIQGKYPTQKGRAGKKFFCALRNHPGIEKEKEMSGAIKKRWDQSNTVLIDDSTLKAAGNPYNILQVPEFTNEPNNDDSTVLMTVLAKIRALAKSNDVSQRLHSWGEEGIEVRRDEVLGYSSSSSSSSEESEGEGEGEGEGELSTTDIEASDKLQSMVFETENQIVPRALSKSDGPSSSSSYSFKVRARLEKAKRKAAKKRQRKAERLEAGGGNPQAAASTTSATAAAGEKKKPKKKRKKKKEMEASSKIEPGDTQLQ